MKYLNKVFSSIYLFFEAIDDGRPGNKGTSLIGAIFALTMLLTANVLSFFSAEGVSETKWLYFLVVIVNCFFLVTYFCRKKRYLKIINEFNRDRNRDIFHLIAVIYVVLSIMVFVMTR